MSVLPISEGVPVIEPAYFGFGSSNQVYSNSIPIENITDIDGIDDPSRPYIPDSSDSVAFTAFGVVPNANGGSVAANIITLQPASATFPGGVTTGTQTLAGVKTFANAINLVPTLSASVGTIQQNGVPIIQTFGTNSLYIGPGAGDIVTARSDVIEISDGTMGTAVSGDIRIGHSATTACYIAGIGGVAAGGTPQMVAIDPITNKMGSQSIPTGTVATLGPVGAAPNSNAGTITGSVLNLEPASAAFPGVVIPGTQAFTGIKTFNDAVNIIPSALPGVGTYQQAGVPIFHTFGSNNMFVGASSGNFVLSGNGNVGVGSLTLDDLSSGSANTALGRGAGSAITTGALNTCVGNSAGISLTTGLGGTYVGGNAGQLITTGNENIIVGGNAGTSIAAGGSNIIEISNGTMGVCVTGDIRIGTSATTACYIAGIGSVAAGGTPEMVTINPVTSKMGSQAIVPAVTTLAAIGATPNANGMTLTGSTLNLQPASSSFGGAVIAGVQSFGGVKTFVDSINISNTTGLSVGSIQQAGGRFLHTFGTNNLFLGPGSGNYTTTGNGNVGIGGQTLQTSTTSTACTAVGLGAGAAVTSAAGCTIVGNSAGFALTSATANTLVGTNAGQLITTGSNNILVGINSGPALITGSNIIEISDGTIGSAVAGDLRIGQATTTAAYIRGIGGVSSGGTPQTVVIDPVTHKMGSAVIVPAVTTLAAIGATPNANGMTLTGSTLNLQPASTSFGGVLTTSSQTIAGDKYFAGVTGFGMGANTARHFDIPLSSSSSVGLITQNGARILHSYGGVTNLFLGYNSGNFSTTSTNATSLGYQTLDALTSGVDNTAIGSAAGGAITSGGSNICVGYQSGSGLTTESNSINIGNSIVGAANTTNIGTGSTTACTIRGISGSTSASGVAVLCNTSGVLGTILSSQKYKHDIIDLPASVTASLKNLRIRQFRYLPERDPDQTVNYGVIAEEALTIMPELVTHENDDPAAEPRSFQYLNLIPILVRAVQELEARVVSLEAKK